MNQVNMVPGMTGEDIEFNRVLYRPAEGFPIENELIVNTTSAENCCIACQNTVSPPTQPTCSRGKSLNEVIGLRRRPLLPPFAPRVPSASDPTPYPPPARLGPPSPIWIRKGAHLSPTPGPSPHKPFPRLAHLHR